MNTRIIFISAAIGVLAASCAPTVPRELVNARHAYRMASEGPAATAAPAEVHVAMQALAAAEQSFKNEPESYRTRDLAYIAQRKCQMAEATASISKEKSNKAKSNETFQTEQGEILTQTQADLENSQNELTSAYDNEAMTAEQLAAEKQARTNAEAVASTERTARITADKRAADAQLALAKLAAVKNEPRGMVITLSGSVLFASGKSALLPSARTQLDQVADVLFSTKERNITIEGHTDSQGSDSNNMTLSQKRADEVRLFFVTRGYQRDLIVANGLGENSPVADNGSAEGRANNRRVEIIVANSTSTASAQ